MEVVLGDNLNDCTKDDAISHLSVNISNGDTSNAMTYVLIKHIIKYIHTLIMNSLL